LQILAPLPNEFVDLLVLTGEVSELVTELGCLASPLNLNFTCESLELDVSWSHLLLNGEKLQVELLLIGLLQEGNEELGSLEDLRAKDTVKEPLVVRLTLDELSWSESLHLLGRKWWNHSLRV